MTVVAIATAAVIIFLIIFIIIGWCRGFLRMILTMLSLVATLVIAAFLLVPVTTYLVEHTEIEKSIEKSVSVSLGWEPKEESKEETPKDDKDQKGAFDLSKIIQALKELGIEVPEDADAEALTELIEKAEDSGALNEKEKEGIEEAVIESLRLPEVLKKIVITKNNVSEYIRLGADSFKQYVVKSISMIALKIMAYIALVIAIYILIRLLLLLTKVLENIPVIRGINRFFGAVVGFIEASLILWLLCMVISLISGTDFGKQVLDVIGQSAFLSYLYEQNLVLRLVNAFFALF